MKQNKLFALALVFLCVMAVSACTRSNALTGGSSWPGITVDDDVVYIANGSFVEAVQNGQKLWNYPEPANNRLSFFAAPAVNDSYVIAGTYSNQLHILNKDDGTLAASAEVGNNKNKIIASPIIVGDKVYVLSSGGTVSCYTINVSGEALTPDWQTTLSSEIWVMPDYNDGTLYVVSMDKKMNLLDAATGGLKQSFEIGAVMSHPVLSDGKLYFSTLSKEVNEMDLATNEIRTILKADDEIWASPLLMGDKLIAADMNGAVYGVDIATGEVKWKTEKLTANKNGFIAALAALDDKTFVLIDEDGSVMTYDIEGKSIGQRSMGQPVYTDPEILSNGSIVIVPVSEDGQIKVYTQDLKEDWIYTRSTGNAAAAEKTAEPAAENTAEPTAAEAK